MAARAQFAVAIPPTPRVPGAMLRRGNLFGRQSAAALPVSLLVGTFVLLALGGGASRANTLSLLFVRPGLLAALLAAALLPWRIENGGVRPLLILTGLFGAWITLQLVPLPDALWRIMPGHAPWTAANGLVGGAPWRPISLDPDATLNALIALLTPLTVLVTAGLVGRDGRMVAPAIIVSIAMASAVLGLVQIVTNSGPFYAVPHPSPSGLFANRNHQALLLAIGIPFAALWATRRTPLLPQAARAAIGGACILLLAGMIPATGSRAGLVLGLIGIAALPAVIPSRFLHGAGARYTALAGLAVLLLIGSVLYFGRAEAINRLFAMSSLRAEGRVEFLPVTWSILRDFLPFGTGVSVFDPVYRAYEPDSALHTTFFNRAHNDWLELVLGGGLVTGALLLALIVVLVRGLIYNLSIDPDRRASRPWIAAAATALVQGALASVVDYPLRTPLLAGVITLVAVIALAPPAPSERVHRRPAGRS